jgi:hypothetical protein
MSRKEKIIIGNCSGFLGDRFSAAAEMVRGGEIDVLTGDYLAELTMAILLKKKLKDPDGGYVPTFLRQMEEVMGECLERGIKVAVNAGGLNPPGLASRLEELAERLGLAPKIACITGDDLMPDLPVLQNAGEEFAHMEKGIPLNESPWKPLSANAYLGGWGIAKGLEIGADIVIGGRIADASLLLGPAAWHFGWKMDEWDALAGAVAAGHIIECGAQATGGNYSFFEEVRDFGNIGFPLAEIEGDGSFIITKHPGTGGLVSTGTVKAQLLYEVRGPAYITPDVTARFDTLEIEEESENRVRVRGAKGAPPPESAKVSINLPGGHKNSMTIVLTGLDIEKKADIVRETLFQGLGGKDLFEIADVQLVKSQRDDPLTNEEAVAMLRVSLIDPDPDKVGRAFSDKVVEMALANIPGFTLTAPPGKSTPVVRYWPALINAAHIKQKVRMDGGLYEIKWPPAGPGKADHDHPERVLPPVPKGKSIKIPLGRLYGTRSGDKGGDANLGVWTESGEAYAFLLEFLSVEKLKELLPDLSGYEIECYRFRNLCAVNFYIKGILGEGAGASVRFDPQAKTLGEYLRSKIIEVPESLLVYARGQ